MSDLAIAGIAIAVAIWIFLIWIKDWFLNSVFFLLVVLAYSSGYLQTLIPVRFAIFSVIVAAMCALSLQKEVHFSPRTRTFIAVFLTVLCLVFSISFSVVATEYLDRLFRYSLLYPVAFLLGYLVSKTTKAVNGAKIYVGVSVVMALLAVTERLRGTFFVAGAYANSDRLVRDGSIRSIVFAEHPLVLSVLLLAAFPLVQVALRSRAIRLFAYAVLASGVISTNSRGAVILMLSWSVVVIALKIKLLTVRAGKFFRGITFSAIALSLVVLLFGTGTDAISSASATTASAEYRSTLYGMAARSLIERPWGWGLPGLPEGIYVVASYFGPLDISKTIDSEFALSMIDFGWFGVFGLLVLLGFLLNVHRLITPQGQMGLLLSASGTYLALHAWVGLGSVWFLALGLATSTTYMGNPHSHPDAYQLGIGSGATHLRISDSR